MWSRVGLGKQKRPDRTRPDDLNPLTKSKSRPPPSPRSASTKPKDYDWTTVAAGPENISCCVTLSLYQHNFRVMCHRRMLGDGPSDWFWQHRVSSECAMWIHQVNIKSYISIFSLNHTMLLWLRQRSYSSISNRVTTYSNRATVQLQSPLPRVQRWLTVNHEVVLNILQQQTGLCLFCFWWNKLDKQRHGNASQLQCDRKLQSCRQCCQEGSSLYLEQNQQRHMFDPFLFTLGINELPYVQSRVW